MAITAAEQSFHVRPQTSPNNLWGRMFPRCCILKKYASLEEGIQDMDTYFKQYWEQRRQITTVEGLNGRYVVPASANWYNTVTKVKKELEAL